MSFSVILLALLLERMRSPTRGNSTLREGLYAWALSAGRYGGAELPWCILVLLPSAAVFSIHWALQHWLGWPLALLWSVAMLCVTLSLRPLLQRLAALCGALQEGDTHRAYDLLDDWGGEMPPLDAGLAQRAGNIGQCALAYAAIAAHRHVFGVLAWYLALAAFGLGPAGAVLYRLAQFAALYWDGKNGTNTNNALLQRSAARAWQFIDWLPARLTALCFAQVRSFALVAAAWQQYVRSVGGNSDAVVLAAAVADVAVPVPQAQTELRSFADLVWRALALWLLLLGGFCLASLSGRVF